MAAPGAGSERVLPEVRYDRCQRCRHRYDLDGSGQWPMTSQYPVCAHCMTPLEIAQVASGNPPDFDEPEGRGAGQR